MNLSALFLDVISLIWQALAISVRLLRWLVSQYSAASNHKAALVSAPVESVPTTASFQNMPLNLQAEVLRYLNWKEVLRVRRTCKSWNRATKTRTLWADLITRFTSHHQTQGRHRSPTPPPEEPLETYSASELEHWLLTRLSVEFGWRNEKQEPTRYRAIKCDAPVVLFHLVEGGRWLLVPDVEGVGRVSVYDLDGRSLGRGVHLIEPLEKLDAQRTSMMAVEVDREADRLVFNLVLTTCVTRDAHPAHVRIYRVELRGHGSNAYLEAKHLTSFAIPGIGKYTSVDLKGDMFARARKTQEGSYIEVYKWSQSTSIVHTRVRIPIEHGIEQLRFVETNRIVAFSHTHMFIFPIPAFQTVQANTPDALDVIPPLWILPCNGTRLYRGGLSPLSYDPLTLMTRFVLCSPDGIYGISIPSDKRAKPRLTKLVEYATTTEAGYSLGLSKAFFRHRDSSSTTVSYVWIEDEVKRNREFRLRASVAIRERGYPGQWDADPPVADEMSGRIVQFTKTGLIVLDMGLCYDSRAR